MPIPHQIDDAARSKFVIPVRYVFEGEAVQTTSTSVTADLIHVRAARPPRTGMTVSLRLYSPQLGSIVQSTGLVARTTDGPTRGFWAELTDSANHADRIAALLARQRDTGDRGCPRFVVDLPGTIRADGRSVDGRITNISRTGAFLALSRCVASGVVSKLQLPPLGAIAEVSVALPGHSEPEAVLAHVVHVAQACGAGIQFIGGTDRFRDRLDEYVSHLAEASSGRKLPSPAKG